MQTCSDWPRSCRCNSGRLFAAGGRLALDPQSFGECAQLNHNLLRLHCDVCLYLRQLRQCDGDLLACNGIAAGSTDVQCCQGRLQVLTHVRKASGKLLGLKQALQAAQRLALADESLPSVCRCLHLLDICANGGRARRTGSECVVTQVFQGNDDTLGKSVQLLALVFELEPRLC